MFIQYVPFCSLFFRSSFQDPYPAGYEVSAAIAIIFFVSRVGKDGAGVSGTGSGGLMRGTASFIIGEEEKASESIFSCLHFE